MELKTRKMERGITLIALVVTIIVLIILAGISINLILGENGIITKAQEASKEQKVSELQEEVAMKMSEREIDKKTGTAKEVEQYLNKIKGVQITKVKADTWYVEKNEVGITVYEDGEIVREKVEIWDGGSEIPKIKNGNWYIYNAKQFKFLADYVNGTNVEKQSKMIQEAGYEESDFAIDSETVIYLMSYIDLGARKINGEWENEENENLEWTAIGKDVILLATVEGNGNTIRGMYENENTDYNGIFGNANTIKKLTIKDSYIKGDGAIGGIVGRLRGGIIEDCHNVNTIIIGSSNNVGGIVGILNADTMIEKSTNTGTITALFSVGGIAGQSQATKISNCSNNGIITATGLSANGNSQIGGIVGLAMGNIENCKNTGDIIGKGKYVGGIIGGLSKAGAIDKSVNEGKIKGEAGWIGGIAGVVNTSTPATITECYNTGKITGKIERIAGIVGSACPSTTIDKCYNIGTILEGGEFTGGIVGIEGQFCTISNCYNIGTITGKNNTGGIAGTIYPSVTVSNCYNTGAITGENATGGIGGLMEYENDVTNSKVEKCYNSGSVNGVVSVGGIVGVISGSLGKGTVIQCYNKGTITGTTQVGAVIGSQTNTTGLNTLNHLYYLNTVAVGAINGEDDEENDVMATTDDVISYEQFLEWIIE